MGKSNKTNNFGKEETVKNIRTIEKEPALLDDRDKVVMGNCIRAVEGVKFVHPWHYIIKFQDGSKIQVPRNKKVTIVDRKTNIPNSEK